jgi:RIO-like serine/threonine protein kinase
MHSVGNQIGVGKESGTHLFPAVSSLISTNIRDIYIVADAEGKEMVLKLHRFVISSASGIVDHGSSSQAWSNILPSY